MLKQLLSLGLAVLVLIGMSTLSSADHFEVLLINGDSKGENNEAPVVKDKTDLDGHTFAFTEINIGPGSNRPPSGAEEIEDLIGDDIILSDFQLIYFAWNGPGHDGSYFMGDVEDDFLDWVKGGGIVYMSAMDDNFASSPGTWMPLDDFPVIVQDTSDAGVDKITEAGEQSIIFKKPNELDDGDIDSWTLDDNFQPENPDDWEIYATRSDNGAPIVCYLPYGDGGYLECCIDARSTFPAAETFVENALYFMADRSVPEAVKPSGKLSTIWGDLKNQ